MGSRLLIATALGAALSSVPAHAQPGPLPAADSAKQGIDLYKAGDYAGAVAPLQRAVEMEPNNFEYRFTLAQALRQSGNCGEAVPHYKQASSLAPADRAEEVKTAMAACPNSGISAQPATPAPPPPPAEPQVIYRSSGSLSGMNAALLFGSGAGLAAGASLFLAAHWDSNDADAAASYENYSRIGSRADTLRLTSLACAGVGVALGVVAIIRIRSSKEEGTQVSLSPTKGGGTLVLERSW